ncbi:aldo/keto reductase [Saccharicrinis sp. GN24d3]|uniref:aldo/keto reductase n=1 Tax=Saccharicrinis sp. GN24d3 TaxID=3458416 RepID=UPI0040354A66
MLYRKMPKSGDKISALGFGCMRFPVLDQDPSKIDESKATEMLHYAIEQGVNYLDTAFPYHGTGMGEPGNSEPFLGKALKGSYRKKIKLASKLPSWSIQSRKDMDKYLNLQLKRLDTDCIDYYLLHTLSVDFWANLKKLGVTDFLDQAIKDGKIKHAGFSFHDNSKTLFKEIVDAYDWTLCQIQYNYLDEHYQAGKEGMQYAANKGMGVVVMEPLRGGSLATKLPDAAVQAFQEVKPERTPAEWSLRWLWNHPEVTVILSGMNTMAHLQQNIKSANDAKANEMPGKELETIENVKSILHEKVRVGCTSCGYCMPCPVGVHIPQNFSYLNDFYRFDDKQTKSHTRIMYSRLLSDKEKASACVECGKCEEHCPQHIPIREKLKEASETLLLTK